MNPYPHVYSVNARGSATGIVPVVFQGVPAIDTAPPPEFDGPGDVWSADTLLVAAVADCCILTFRSLTRAAKFDWERVECQVEGVLERAERLSMIANSLRGERHLEVVIP